MASPTQDHLTIRRATPKDAPVIADLINAAFRNDDTTDVYLCDKHDNVDLVSGRSVLKSLETDNLVVFVGVVPPSTSGGSKEDIVAHFSLRRKVVPSVTLVSDTPSVTTAWLALLAVLPTTQKRGWGSQLVSYAERFAREEWAAARMEFDVVNTRSQLRAWYEKKGYRPTGNAKPFAYELHPGWQGVLRDDLEFLDYGKDL